MTFANTFERCHVEHVMEISPISMPRVNGVSFWKTIEFVGLFPLNCYNAVKNVCLLHFIDI